MTKVNDRGRADLRLRLTAAASGCFLGGCTGKDGHFSASPLTHGIESVHQTDSVGAETIAQLFV